MNNDENSLKVFSKILAFGKELNDIFGTKHNNIHLYYKLLKKTPIGNKNAISKHINIFEKFYTNNKQFIIEKSIDKLISENISFSEKVFINIKTILIESDIETCNTIFKHLQLISYIITGEKILKEAITSTSLVSTNKGPSNLNLLNNMQDKENNEQQFLNGFMNKIEGAFKDKNYDNPLSATMDLLQSGVFTDVVNSMSRDINS